MISSWFASHTDVVVRMFCRPLITILLAMPIVSLQAQEQPELSDLKFSMGIGGAFVSYNTQVRLVEKSTDRSIFIDAEGTLGLPESALSPLVFGRYRFNHRHAIAFSAFGTRRENTLIDGEFDFGDVEVAGSATFTDSSDFYFLNYTYTFFEDPRARIFGSIGLYTLDLAYTFAATGVIRENDVVGVEESLFEEASVFAPLPTVGMDFAFALTDRWIIASRVSLVTGSAGKVRNAFVLDTAIRAQYAFSEHIGIGIGVQHLDATVDINNSSTVAEVNYGYDGLFLALGLRF